MKLKLLILALGNVGVGLAVAAFIAFLLYRRGQQMNTKKLLIFAVGGLFLSFILMQFMSFIFPQIQASNPEVTNTVQWDSPETEVLWNRACQDCHSNETVWPWYSNIAPVSWLVAGDVNEGRSKLNISESRRIETDEMTEQIERGKMPMGIYVIMHSEANLSDAETQQLISGLRATFGSEGGRRGSINTPTPDTQNTENNQTPAPDNDDDDD